MSLEKVVPDEYNLHRKRQKLDISERGFTEKYYSKNDLKTGILDFVIEGNNEQVIIPSQTFLSIEFEIAGTAERVKTGTVPTPVSIKDAPTDKPLQVYPVNNIFHSAFESVDVYVGNQAINKPNRHNPFISYFQTLTKFNDSALSTYFNLTGWSKDTAHNEDSGINQRNTGMVNRLNMFNLEDGGYRGVFVGRICSPLFDQDKVIPPSVGLRILMKKANDKFCLMNETGDFKLNIIDAVLMVRKVVPTPKLRSALGLMSDHPMKIDLVNPSINYYIIEQASTQFKRDDIFLGRSPNNFKLAFVASNAVHGNIAQNPFYFNHYAISNITVSKDGQEYPCPAIVTDFANKEYSEAYHNFMNSLGASYSNQVPSINFNEYGNGYTIFSYDMSPDQLGKEFPSSVGGLNSGIRLEIKFSTPLPHNVTLLIYSEMEDTLEIHKNNQVTMNF